MQELTLSAAERFDNYTSAASSPIRTLSHALSGIERVRSVSIPVRVWRAMLAHDEIRRAIEVFEEKPRFELSFLGVNIIVRRPRAKVLQVIEDLLVLSSGTVHITHSRSTDILIEGATETVYVRRTLDS